MTRKISMIIWLLVLIQYSFAQKSDSLERNIKTLKEVKVSAKRNSVGKTRISSKLSGSELAESRGLSLGETIKNMPGVNLLQTGGTIAKPVIHGLHSNRILILNNGLRHEGQQWGAEHAPEIDPYTASSIYVIKGAEAVRYGAEAIGGVIVMEPGQFPEEVLTGELNLSGASNGRKGGTAIILSGRLPKHHGFAWRVQSSIGKSGNLRTADYYLGNTGERTFNYAGAVQYSAPKAKYELYHSHFGTELGILYSAHVGTIEDIHARIALGKPLEKYGFSYAITAPRQQVAHDLLKLKSNYQLNQHSFLELVYGFQRNHRQEFDSRRGGREALPITDMVLSNHNLDAVYKHLRRSGLEHSLGLSSSYQVNNNISGTLAVPFVPNFESFAGGLFAIEKLQKGDVELEFGIRYDLKTFNASGYRYNSAEGPVFYQGNRHFHNLTGSLGALWNISKFWQLSTNAGLAWRAPSANELYSDGLHHGAGLYEIGDPDLKTEKGYKWISSIKYEQGKLSINLDPYVQYISNYIFAQPDGGFSQSNRGTFPIFKYRQTNASFSGADLSVFWQMLPGWSYNLNASVVRATDLSNGLFLPYIPGDRLSNSLRWENEISKTIPSLYIAAGHVFKRRQNRFSAQSDYADPPPAYHLFNAQVGGTYKIGLHELRLGITADNLFNTLYKDYMNRFRYYSHDAGRNITLRMAWGF